jgi:hypothetical protein
VPKWAGLIAALFGRINNGTLGPYSNSSTVRYSSCAPAAANKEDNPPSVPIIRPTSARLPYSARMDHDPYY